MFQGAPLRAYLVALLCSAQIGAACTSMEESAPEHVDVALPRTAWTVSTYDSQWRASPPAGSIPGFVCSGPQALGPDCCDPPWDCQRYPLACDPTVNMCALTFDVQLAQTVALDAEVSAIAEVPGRVFSKVDLLALEASVAIAGELPVRSLALFIGPVGMADSSAATLLAPIGTGAEPQPLFPGLAARSVLSELARNYATPFTLLLTAHAVVPDKLNAEGELQVTLDGKLRAYY